MSRGTITSTSYAVLGLLAARPWASYELARQMDRSLRRFWPRAESKLYEEPKKLVAHGLARSTTEKVGRRSRTVYTISAKGRRALAEWLRDPGAGPVLEYEQLVKVFFSDSGTKADLVGSLDAAKAWATERLQSSVAIGEEYLRGEGMFPRRAAHTLLVARFLDDFYAAVSDWASWASEIVDDWPDDPADAVARREDVEETVRRATRAAAR